MKSITYYDDKLNQLDEKVGEKINHLKEMDFTRTIGIGHANANIWMRSVGVKKERQARNNHRRNAIHVMIDWIYLH